MLRGVTEKLISFLVKNRVQADCTLTRRHQLVTLRRNTSHVILHLPLRLKSRGPSYSERINPVTGIKKGNFVIILNVRITAVVEDTKVSSTDPL